MWIEAIEAGELEKGKIVCKKFDKTTVIIAQAGEEVFACGSVCPHQGVSMCEGWVFDDEITCPEHSWVFSLRTGELTWPGAGPRIPIYQTRKNGDMVEIFIEKEKGES
jgi:nitrite reductase/ring-hydroxylating ferredoxin subunit